MNILIKIPFKKAISYVHLNFKNSRFKMISLSCKTCNAQMISTKALLLPRDAGCTYCNCFNHHTILH